MFTKTENTEQYHRLLNAPGPKEEALKMFFEAKTEIEKAVVIVAWDLYKLRTNNGNS